MLGHFSKTHGMSLICSLFLPCSKKTSHPIPMWCEHPLHHILGHLHPPVSPLLLGDKSYSLVPKDRGYGLENGLGKTD